MPSHRRLIWVPAQPLPFCRKMNIKSKFLLFLWQRKVTCWKVPVLYIDPSRKSVNKTHKQLEAGTRLWLPRGTTKQGGGPQRRGSHEELHHWTGAATCIAWLSSRKEEKQIVSPTTFHTELMHKPFLIAPHSLGKVYPTESSSASWHSFSLLNMVQLYFLVY